MAVFDKLRRGELPQALATRGATGSIRQPDRDWLTVEETAGRTGFSMRTVYRAIDAGDLKAFKRHRQWRITPNDADAWVRGGDQVARRHTPRGSRRRLHAVKVSGSGFLAQHLQATEVER